jgi:pterin-4a-carbinolamine dehydratase
MMFGRLPVEPSATEVPLVAVERWVVSPETKMLTKTFKFHDVWMRNEFLTKILTYEAGEQHNAVMTVTEDEVKLELVTKNTERITERDKEYARFADDTFKDLFLQPSYLNAPEDD